MVFEIATRGRCVGGDIIDGTLRVGMLLRPEAGAPHVAWRIVGVEFVDFSAGVSQVALVLEDAPPVEILASLLPAGSMLVAEDPGAEGAAPRGPDAG